MPWARAPSRRASSSFQVANEIIGERSKRGRGAIPTLETAPPFEKGERAQILAGEREDIVKTNPGGIVAQHRGRHQLAVEPLLQIVERRDLAVAQHKQLAVEHNILRD